MVDLIRVYLFQLPWSKNKIEQDSLSCFAFCLFLVDNSQNEDDFVLLLSKHHCSGKKEIYMFLLVSLLLYFFTLLRELEQAQQISKASRKEEHTYEHCCSVWTYKETWAPSRKTLLLRKIAGETEKRQLGESCHVVYITFG